MKIFVINLTRRHDRRIAITNRLARLNIKPKRIPAIDAACTSDTELQKFFVAGGPLGTLSKGDQCCSLSHRRAWSAFLATGEEYAAILEDDIVLAPISEHLLRDQHWIPDGAQLIKLEHFGPEGQRVLVGRASDIGYGRSIAPIMSRHTGAAAYIISRSAAQLLMQHERWNVPVDHLLFNPNVSPFARSLKPLQVIPAIARQSATSASDIRASRQEAWRPSLKLLRREIVRAYYECRLLPMQIAALLAGHAHIASVANASPTVTTTPTYQLTEDAA